MPKPLYQINPYRNAPWNGLPSLPIKKELHHTLEIVEKLGELTFIPVIFTSVSKKQRIFQAIEKAIEVYQNRSQKVSTSKLNEKMLREIERYPPPAYKGKYIKIKYCTQLPSPTPTFAFFCNLPQYVKHAYERFTENKLRSHFNFEGVPIRIYFRKK